MHMSFFMKTVLLLLHMSLNCLGTRFFSPYVNWSESVFVLLVQVYYDLNLHTQKQLFADVLQNRCSKNFCNIQRKIPLLESLSSKVFSKETPTQVFPREYCEILKNSFFIEHL